MITGDVLYLILARARCDRRHIVSPGHLHLVRLLILLLLKFLFIYFASSDGTLRWQAPEMMGGHHNRLTQEMDIYAFAICCVEILDKGIMPWQHHDDFAIVRFVTGAYCLFDIFDSF